MKNFTAIKNFNSEKTIEALKRANEALDFKEEIEFTDCLLFFIFISVAFIFFLCLVVI